MTNVPQYRWKRRLVQFATLMLIALVPASGLLRIDLTTASFFVFEHQIAWSNFTLVFGLALIFATGPILTYMTIGTVWCGWACPQNMLTEWANNLTYKLLGKRASVEVGGDGLIVAAAKNKLINWMMLGLSFLLVSLLLAVIPFLFFYTPRQVWGMVTFSNTEMFSPFMLYLFMVFLIFIDIAVVRYFLCDYGCLYRIGQRIFKTHDALHVTYDATRSDDCSKCNYCATSCITNIQPIAIKPLDPCINCGECIDACDRLHAKNGTLGLLDFELSSKTEVKSWYRKLGSMLLHTNWLVAGLFFVGVAMTVWGIVTQPEELPPVPLAVQLKAREVARICGEQCAPQQILCKTGNMVGCYRAAACKCECSLQQDPSNPAAAEWQQCAQRNRASAETASMRSAAATKK